MKIPTVESELFSAVERTDGRTDRQADRQTNMTHQIFAFRNVQENN